MKSPAGLLAAAALVATVACSDNLPVGVSNGRLVEPVLVNGQVLANTYCTPCHGADLRGTQPAAQSTSPAGPGLGKAGGYTWQQFDLLLQNATRDDGQWAGLAMTTCRNRTLTAEERRAIFDYLNSL